MGDGRWAVGGGLLDGTHIGPPGSSLVVAVSGGADSCALWDLLVLAGRWPLLIWHLDHGLRSASADDAAFVQARGQYYGAAGGMVLVECVDLRALARTWRCGLEAAGRRHRHARLTEVARAHGIAVVLTAHHQDDQAETVLMNLLRGAGDAGVAGIPPRRRLAAGVALVRPLIGCTRAALRDHLRSRGLDWREDASNADPQFTRNRLRRAVLPALELGMPGVAGELAAAALAAQRRLTESRRRAAALWDGTGTRLALAPALAASPSVRSELWLRLLRAQGCPLRRSHVHRLEALTQAAPDTRLHLGGTVFVREATAIAWFSAADRPLAPILLSVPGLAWLPEGILTLTEVPVPHDPRTGIFLDAGALRPPLVWRRPAPGERWTPLGSPGSQTLTDSLAARRVPAWQRPLTPVLADAEGVLWLPAVGLVADRVRIGPGTTRCLAATLSSGEELDVG